MVIDIQIPYYVLKYTIILIYPTAEKLQKNVLYLNLQKICHMEPPWHNHPPVCQDFAMGFSLTRFTGHLFEFSDL